MNQELKEQAREEFKNKFGQFYVSIDSKTKAIRIVDIEDGVKVNGEDGSLIECVASGDIQKYIDSLIDKTVQMERERIVGIIEESKDGSDEDVVLNYIISLITNKSELSTNKDEK